MSDLRVATLDNGVSTISETAIRGLRKGLQGRMLLAGDKDYDATRKVWNAATDKKPALIAQCASAADVITAVNFVRDNGLLVAVRGGGHSVAGHSVCDNGFMIDLAEMNHVRVDTTKHTAHAGGGAKWGDVDHATQAFGLATTGGTNSDTGIGGLTLGGGLGWLASKYGLTCDNLLSAEVVTADGHLLTASATENRELFWALRGGGGNFGVVTSFEFQLHHVGPVFAGMVVHPFENAKNVLRFYSEFTRDIPDELNTVSVLLTAPDGRKVVTIAVCYSGAMDMGEKTLRPLRAFGPPLMDQIAPMPYTAIQAAMDASFPRGRHYYWKAHLIKHINERVINTLIEHFRKVPSPFTALGFQQLGNTANRVCPNETAFSHRDARYDFLMLSGWDKPSEAERNISWTRELYEVMLPSLHTGIYVNAISEDMGPGISAAYLPDTYKRLTAIKSEYDPTNLFRLNPNIRPTG